jgi:hypothetical protein
MVSTSSISYTSEIIKLVLESKLEATKLNLDEFIPKFYELENQLHSDDEISKRHRAEGIEFMCAQNMWNILEKMKDIKINPVYFPKIVDRPDMLISQLIMHNDYHMHQDPALHQFIQDNFETLLERTEDKANILKFPISRKIPINFETTMKNIDNASPNIQASFSKEALMKHVLNANDYSSLSPFFIDFINDNFEEILKKSTSYKKFVNFQLRRVVKLPEAMLNEITFADLENATPCMRKSLKGTHIK